MPLAESPETTVGSPMLTRSKNVKKRYAKAAGTTPACHSVAEKVESLMEGVAAVDETWPFGEPSSMGIILTFCLFLISLADEVSLSVVEKFSAVVGESGEDSSLLLSESLDSSETMLSLPADSSIISRSERIKRKCSLRRLCFIQYVPVATPKITSVGTMMECNVETWTDGEASIQGIFSFYTSLLIF